MIRDTAWPAATASLISRIPSSHGYIGKCERISLVCRVSTGLSKKHTA